jgi:excinuclease UvrABC nuclease subunit
LPQEEWLDGSEFWSLHWFQDSKHHLRTDKRTVSTSCNYDLSKSNIETGKIKVCLEYHIGNCKGPCEGLNLLENYQKQVDAIREILKGNFKESMKERL